MVNRYNRDRLHSVYKELYACYGPQHWWPAQTPFEVMVGAILTQNTAWPNVEKAIGNLRRADCLGPEAILALPASRLARLLTPSGYFNVKARRLRAFCLWYQEQGGYVTIARSDTAMLRHDLLSVNGIGPETADDILLYAFERQVFVVDAYTRRLFARLGITDTEQIGYEQLRGLAESNLPADAGLYNEYHALLVRHAKEICRRRPVCERCCLAGKCPGRDV